MNWLNYRSDSDKMGNIVASYIEMSKSDSDKE